MKTIALAAALLAGVVHAEEPPPRAIVAGNQFVQPLTGEILGPVPGASSYDLASPIAGSDGCFRIGKLLVDAATRQVTGSVFEEITFAGQDVIRRNVAGDVIWSHTLEGNLGSVRPPDRLASGTGVFVVAGNGIVALDRATGEERWRAAGQHHRLVASGPLLLATCAGSPADPKHGYFLVARDAKTGDEVFRSSLPDETDPLPIREIGDLFVVSDVGFAGAHPAYTRCFDRQGKLRFESAEPLSEMLPAGKDLVILTPSRTARIDAAGKTIWELKDLRGGEAGGAGISALPGGDIVAFTWGPHSDTGVDVMRVSAGGGKLAWKTHCEELGVGHSKYWHQCYVEARGEVLVVVSQAAGGHFVEVLDAATGKSVKRTLVH